MKSTQIWLSTQQAAERAGRHPDTVRRALIAGELHGHQAKANACWRAHVDCVDAWLLGQPCPHQIARAS